MDKATNIAFSRCRYSTLTNVAFDRSLTRQSGGQLRYYIKNVVYLNFKHD